MFVLFDTNVIIQDFNMKSDNFRILKENSDRYGIKMFVSDVVIDEVVNKYREKLIGFNNDNKDYFRIIPKEYLNKIDNDEIEKMVKDYRKQIRSYFADYNCYGTRLVPVTYENYLSVYDKAINKVKPFNTNGKGFKDALIWEAIKWIVLTYCDEERKLAFISNNVLDFSDKEKINDSKWYIPAKHLREEYTQDGYNIDTVRIYDSLTAFNLDVIHKKTSALNAIKASFDNATIQAIFAKIKQETFTSYNSSYGEFEYKVNEIDNLEVLDAYNMYGTAPDDIILSIELDMYCEPIHYDVKPFWTKGELYINVDVNTYEIRDIRELHIKSSRNI